MQPRYTLRRDRPHREVHTPTKPVVEDEHGSTTERRIVCAVCGHHITTERERIEVQGRHEHRCVNPDSVIFHIGCFQRAPGCASHGVPTLEFTWFPGFAWNYALCNSCSTLLGWKYHGTDAPSFFGLILSRLATAYERSH